MKRSALRAVAGSVCAVLALAGGLMLGGCSGVDPEEAIRADISSGLDELKNMDEDALAEYADSLGDMGLDAYGIDNETLITAMVDGFDYAIDSVTVDGDTATATVTVTSKSMSELVNLDSDALYEAIMDAVASGELDIADEDAISTWSGEYLMGLVDQIEPTEKSLEFLYTKGDDGWELDEASATTEMSKIFV